MDFSDEEAVVRDVQVPGVSVPVEISEEVEKRVRRYRELAREALDSAQRNFKLAQELEQMARDLKPDDTFSPNFR